MGRIGRTLFRLFYQKGMVNRIVAVNDIMPKENLIYLLKYDSVRGTLPCEIQITEQGFSMDDHEVHYSQSSTIENIPWKNYSLEVIVEATGLFTHSSKASVHLANANRVLLTTFSSDLPTCVFGVNQNEAFNSRIISPGDCTINCVAPIIHLLLKNLGVESVHANVIQAYTTRQQLIDSPYKGLRRGRSAAHSIIPFEVNITPVLETIFPHLKNKINAMSTRVPVVCGALADLSINLKSHSTTDEINELILNASKNELKNISSITFDPIVSADVLGNSHSSLVDGSLTKVIDGTHVKLLVWFDNEWGYANRLSDWLNSVQKK